MNRMLKYALKNLSNIQTSEKFYVLDDKIYIEFMDGRSLQLSEKEVEHQAIEYLYSEIDCIKFGR